jgi:hypothetical protein
VVSQHCDVCGQSGESNPIFFPAKGSVVLEYERCPQRSPVVIESASFANPIVVGYNKGSIAVSSFNTRSGIAPAPVA